MGAYRGSVKPPANAQQNAALALFYCSIALVDEHVAHSS